MSLKTAGRILVRLTLGLLISFLLLESALLVFDRWVFQGYLWVFDPDLGMRVRPYAAYGGNQANRFGFNDRDYPLAPAPGGFRILVLSDSFNWAGGREWNYVGFVEEKLQSRFGPEVEVINAGYPATHTAEQLALLKKFGMRYQPDLVVLGFFAGNDFSSAQPWRKRIAYGGEAIDIDTRSEGYRLVLGKPVTLQSRFYVNLRGWWKRFQLKRAGGSMGRQRYLRLERSRMLICDPSRTEFYAPYVEFIFESLGKMRDLVTSDGKEFMVVVYPDEFQADPALRQAVIERYRMDVADFDWDRPQSLLAEFCHREGIEFHDLLVPFQEATAAGRRLYIPNNSHWNREGNRLAAELIEEILVPKVSRRLEE